MSEYARAYLVAHYACSPVHKKSELVGWAVLRYEHHDHRVILSYGPEQETLARDLCDRLNHDINLEIDHNL